MRDFSKIKRIIFKIGSSSLVNDDLSVNEEIFDCIMSSFKMLKDRAISPMLVTSGAIALGMHELKLTKRPKEMSLKQACASVGQAVLMQYYNRYAKKYNLVCGQILINHDDFQERKRMLYLSDTLDEMFKHGIIPVVNENDALAVEEIKVGDNDTLSALMAPMVNANLLILFSDIDGLFNKNPKIYNDAYKIDEIDKIDKDIYSYVGEKTCEVGTGGMLTKINAAVIATSASCNMIICNSKEIKNIKNIIDGENIGTLFKATKAIKSKEHWLIYKTYAKGSIVIDSGCVRALENKKVSILPKGILAVNKEFLAGSVIEVIDEFNNIIAKGICNYSSLEIDNMKGLNSQELGNDLKPEVIHANNLVIMKEIIIC